MPRKGKIKNIDTLWLKDVINLFISFKQADGLCEMNSASTLIFPNK